MKNEIPNKSDTRISSTTGTNLHVGTVITIVLGALVLLMSEFEATRNRNKVWQTDLTLWTDTLSKSPTNGRVMMNLGTQLMAMGRYDLTSYYYERAKLYVPDYWILEVNFGVLKDATGLGEEAEFHFKRALVLNPYSPDSYTYYARFLAKHGRPKEADNMLKREEQIDTQRKVR